MNESSSIKYFDIILQSLKSLGKEMPSNHEECLYKSGKLDSAEIMQLVLEIELETEKRIDLVKLMEGDISIKSLINILEVSK